MPRIHLALPPAPIKYSLERPMAGGMGLLSTQGLKSSKQVTVKHGANTKIMKEPD